MFKAVAICCLLAVVAAQELSNEYLPPVQDVGFGGGVGGGAVGGGFGGGAVGGGVGGGAIGGGFEAVDAAPAHSFSSDEGYRYKTAKRRVFKNRRVFRQRRRY